MTLCDARGSRGSTGEDSDMTIKPPYPFPYYNGPSIPAFRLPTCSRVNDHWRMRNEKLNISVR